MIVIKPQEMHNLIIWCSAFLVGMNMHVAPFPPPSQQPDTETRMGSFVAMPMGKQLLAATGGCLWRFGIEVWLEMTIRGW